MNVTNTKSSGSAITSALGLELELEYGGALCSALAGVELAVAGAAAAPNAPAVEAFWEAGERGLVFVLLGALLARAGSGAP